MKKDHVPAHVAALLKAIEKTGGSQRALAAKMRESGIEAARAVSQQTISYWLNNETLIDPEWWPAIEIATGRTVTRKQLRPDVFANGHAA